MIDIIDIKSIQRFVDVKIYIYIYTIQSLNQHKKSCSYHITKYEVMKFEAVLGSIVVAFNRCHSISYSNFYYVKIPAVRKNLKYFSR